MVRLRLKRGGRKKNPFYWIVATDSRKKRDGEFIDKLGIYNPLARGKEEKVSMDEDKIFEWYMKGARATDTVYALMKKQGIVKKIVEEKQKRKKVKTEKIEEIKEA